MQRDAVPGVSAAHGFLLCSILIVEVSQSHPNQFVAFKLPLYKTVYQTKHTSLSYLLSSPVISINVRYITAWQIKQFLTRRIDYRPSRRHATDWLSRY